MGLLDPSNEDQEIEKKPRFLQDFIVLILILGGGIIAIIFTMLFD